MALTSYNPSRLLAAPFAYLVSYDLNGPAGAYADLFQELKNSTIWMHWLKNTWIVLRYEPLADLQNLLVSKIRVTDRMLIVPAKGPAAGWLPKEAWDWINGHVPREW